MIHIRHVEIQTPHPKEFIASHPADGETWVILCFSTDCMILTELGLERARPGDVFIKSSDFREYHYTPEDMEQGFVNDWLHLTSDSVQTLLRELELPVNRLIPTGDKSALRPYLHQMIQEETMLLPYLNLKMENLVFAMLIGLARVCHNARNTELSQYHEGLTALRSAMRGGLDEEWSIPDMAKKLGLSSSRFSVLYKKRFGRSPHDDLMDMRIDKAKELLLYTDRRLADIALSCGFQNEFYFSRVFKARVSVSPGAYRREG